MCQVMLGSSIIKHSLHLQVVSDVNWCREAAAAAVLPTHSRAAALPPEQSNFTQKRPEHHLLNCNSLSFLAPISNQAQLVINSSYCKKLQKLQKATLANFKTWCKRKKTRFIFLDFYSDSKLKLVVAGLSQVCFTRE